jgi:hypothetical protein
MSSHLLTAVSTFIAALQDLFLPSVDSTVRRLQRRVRTLRRIERIQSRRARSLHFRATFAADEAARAGRRATRLESLLG